MHSRMPEFESTLVVVLERRETVVAGDAVVGATKSAPMWLSEASTC